MVMLKWCVLLWLAIAELTQLDPGKALCLLMCQMDLKQCQVLGLLLKAHT